MLSEYEVAVRREISAVKLPMLQLAGAELSGKLDN
jgi:hypothetical protein